MPEKGGDKSQNRRDLHVLNLDALSLFQPLKLDTSFIDSLREIGRTIALTQTQWRNLSAPLFDFIGKVFADSKKADAVLQSGWVPFDGMPLESIDADAEAADTGRLIDEFTSREWPLIRCRLEAAVMGSKIDVEAQATFQEGLAAFDAGLYRSVVRLLFPEIERVARETVYGGDRREGPRGRQTKGKLNTGLRDFREAIMEKLPVGVVADTRYGLSIVQKMYEHLYHWVGDDPESLDRFRSDPVPNRHASQHGYVIYSTRQHAFNMLAMTAFMFELIMRTKAYLEKSSSRASQNENLDAG